MTDIVLAVTEITKSFGNVNALKNVSLNIRKGRVHTLLGENGAGKSTLMKILAGIYPPTKGKIILKGQEVIIANPQYARGLGIAIIFQELSLSNNMSVAENIYANNEPNRFGFINTRKMVSDCQQLLAELAIPLDPQQIVGTMSIAQRQLVEIAKALSYPADVVIMDEPTSSLSDNEAGILFGIIDKLKQRGCAVIYISHRMDEIMRVSDDISVMRDGEYIATHDKHHIDIHRLIAQMVGREMSNIYPPRQGEQPAMDQPPVMAVRHLSQAKLFDDIHFELRSGEVLGFFGLVGSGRSDIMKALFGLTRYQGEIHIDGQRVAIRNPKQAIERGIAFVTENRKEEGLVLMHDVSMNTHHVAFQYTNTALGLINHKVEEQKTIKAIHRMNIKVNSPSQLVSTLSGGNQQKIVLSKWLEKIPRILILDEPTRGVDVGAKFEIYNVIRQLAANGTAIILVSSELPEVMALSDRLVVMRNKKIADIFSTAGLTQTQVMNAATGVK
ncbi:D-xylose ABC transporter ATP-binding protein [Yersinia pseudotuberculosis]|uniref:Xylose transporter ATP-binding subunit n=1 Tax=Yersinia pseudotuberculosis TaxID=633 RepID=A0A0T9J3D9_YERPU|nr:sugar ABC transporter ATP-binding protein [Yersinia pseudotuberculosis]PSH15730.1 D-xylose ABC transporter ATP-binding protein [Yersinia pseudotuberculosis]CNB76896.1 xylose transporter ATP-binding subunit [Yersinia pseudotuberculosis]SUP84624.1 xylose transporter ATP-binding subunit [Yersinia pseudotuberculosis]